MAEQRHRAAATDAAGDDRSGSRAAAIESPGRGEGEGERGTGERERESWEVGRFDPNRLNQIGPVINN